MDALRAALEELVVLGALDKSMTLTSIGQTMAVFPVEPNLAKVLMIAHEKKVLHDACAVAAMLVSGNTLLNPTEKRVEAGKIENKTEKKKKKTDF